MSERLRRLQPGELDEQQAELYQRIVGGARAGARQYFPLKDDDGALVGPFGIMLHEPGLGSVLERLGATIRYRTELDQRTREISILQVAQAMASDFEWWAHEKVARAIGIGSDELAALREASFDGRDAAEQAAVAFTRALLAAEEISDDQYSFFASRLTPLTLLELTVLVGYYRMLAQLMNVFGVSPPDPASE